MSRKAKSWTDFYENLIINRNEQRQGGRPWHQYVGDEILIDAAIEVPEKEGDEELYVSESDRFIVARLKRLTITENQVWYALIQIISPPSGVRLGMVDLPFRLVEEDFLICSSPPKSMFLEGGPPP